MLWLALQLIAAPDQTVALCPAPAIAFAPPLSAPIVLRRRIERELTHGLFVHEAVYRMTFAPAGRGYRIRWQQTGERSEGPAELLRLLELQERAASGDSFDAMLNADGAVLGISEPPGSAERLAQAIDRLRGDPALAARPAEQRAQLIAMLDRLARLLPEERIALQRGWLERPIMLAGRPCHRRQVMTSQGAAYRIVGATADSLHLVAASESVRDGGAKLSVIETVTLARTSGLVERYDRRTVTTVAGTVRNARETFDLEVAPETP